jgi:hypothetical protein
MYAIGTEVRVIDLNIKGTIVVTGKVDDEHVYFVECYKKIVGEALKSELLFLRHNELEEVQ